MADDDSADADAQRDDAGRFVSGDSDDKADDAGPAGGTHTLPDTVTESTDTRSAATNDRLAYILVGTLVGLVAHSEYTSGELPLWLAMVFALAVGTAVVWAFGSSAFASASDVIKSAIGGD